MTDLIVDQTTKRLFASLPDTLSLRADGHVTGVSADLPVVALSDLCAIVSVSDLSKGVVLYDNETPRLVCVPPVFWAAHTHEDTEVAYSVDDVFIWRRTSDADGVHTYERSLIADLETPWEPRHIEPVGGVWTTVGAE